MSDAFKGRLLSISIERFKYRKKQVEDDKIINILLILIFNFAHMKNDR